MAKTRSMDSSEERPTVTLRQQKGKKSISQTSGDEWQMIEYNDQKKIRRVVSLPQQECEEEFETKPPTAVWEFFQEVFLPRGYPDSVSSDYLEYQIWDSLQALGSSLAFNLSNHRVLKGLGVGDASASIIGATLTWMLKDGTGMIGRILFSYLKGFSLDVDCKKWRIFADIINDIAFLIDMISPIFSHYIILVQCSSGLLKSLVGTIGGSTRAAFTQHQARRKNLADVSAKDNSQETLVNLVALVLGLTIVPLIVPNATLTWISFIFFVIFHIYCNYKAVRAVKFEILNQARVAASVDQFLVHGDVLTVQEANNRENVWFFIAERWAGFTRFGVSISDHLESDRRATQVDRRSINKLGFLATYDSSGGIPLLVSFLKDKTDTRMKLRAIFFAHIMYLVATRDYIMVTIFPKIMEKVVENAHNDDYMRAQCADIVENLFEDYYNQLVDEEWDLDEIIFLEDGWRIRDIVGSSS
ncbi:RUS family member 1 [Brevipalpus obovatus]|uniref:RUS family member 1 n=1 Tax=Brevipalpus obovatus TaxID=246614 RepID=UPI003D9F1F3D